MLPVWWPSLFGLLSPLPSLLTLYSPPYSCLRLSPGSLILSLTGSIITPLLGNLDLHLLIFLLVSAFQISSRPSAWTTSSAPSPPPSLFCTLPPWTVGGAWRHPHLQGPSQGLNSERESVLPTSAGLPGPTVTSTLASFNHPPFLPITLSRKILFTVFFPYTYFQCTFF